MHLDEVMLMQRFDSAVADLAPDVTSLVEGGHLRGSAMRRRRRMTAGAGAVVAAAVTVAAIALGQSVFENRSSGPVHPAPDTVEQADQPTTDRALGALMLRHIDAEPNQLSGHSETSESGDVRLLMATGDYDIDGESVQLVVAVQRSAPSTSTTEPCQDSASDKRVDSCQTQELSDGRQVFTTWASEDLTGGHLTSGYVVAVGVTSADGSEVSLAYEQTDQSRPPKGSDVTTWAAPVPVEDLKAIILDPGAGQRTTQSLLDEGEAIDNFRTSR
jgi:hypothetical protein